MKKLLAIALTFLFIAAAGPVTAQEEAVTESTTNAPEEPQLAAPESSSAQVNMCVTCHGESDLWEGERRRFFITEDHLADDIHWKKGISCHDCHGGDSLTLNFREAHSPDTGYRVISSPADLPQFCGHCHSNITYMSRFSPSPKTNQEADYWTSGHGQQIKQSPDSNAATCVSCHSHHGIRATDDLESPTYPTNVAKMCATCHSDAEKMAGIQFHDRPIGHDQFALWSNSVHANLLLEKGDLSAPTCNDCHGNHGAVAPDPTSVASACATCHVKIGELFESTTMKHRFEQTKLPGCATCHGAHDIQTPSDDMLGMDFGAVCASCHAGGQHGATIAGAKEANAMRDALTDLKTRISEAEEKLERAERLGMEVHEAKFRLRDAQSALANARVDIHSFASEPLKQSLEKGISITEEVDEQAEKALQEYTLRRIWLGLSLLPIALVVVVLVLYIRATPLPVVHGMEH